MKHLAAKHRIRSGKNGDDPTVYVVATGGGAYKFYDKITEELKAKVMREDEMECLIIGKLS
jgi:type II pantothenate kinase